jgi:hypothetical protein
MRAVKTSIPSASFAWEGLPRSLYVYTVVSSTEADMHASLRQIYRPRRDPLPHWLRMLWSWL